MKILLSLAIALFVHIVHIFSSPLYADPGEGFPGRIKYHEVPVYELEQLYKNLHKVLVVDARSRFEFDTLRIKGAINIPVSQKTFESRVMRLSQQTTKPIVFYCNGHTCMKSYKAVKKTMALNIVNTFAYDAGIFDWVRAHPDQSVLLGQTPVNLKHLIATKKLKSKTLDPDTFADRVSRLGNRSMVIDIRDKYQRAGIGFFPAKERWISLNKMEKLHYYINKAKHTNKTIFIYDEVGKQVRWLQYALEKANVKNYYFMQKGATGYYDQLARLEWPDKFN